MKLMRNMLAAGALLGAQALLFPMQASAADACTLEISGNDQMQYDKKELDAPASCKEIKVTLKHMGKLPKQAMGHNWVLVKTPDLTAVANAGMGAGLEKDYVTPGDAKVIAHTKVVGGGESDTVTIPASKLTKGEAYSFLCTFPGHNALMRGTFKFG